MTDDHQKQDRADEFVQYASKDRVGLVTEFLDFLKHNKKWWLLPILITFAGIGILALLMGSGAAPFIYTLF
jgi:C4-dicarboxylate transporter